MAGTIVTKTSEEGKKLVGKLEQMFGRNREGSTTIESQSAAVKALQEYRNSLAAISPAAQSRNQAFQMALQVYSEDQTSSKSPFYSALNAAVRAKTSIAAGRVDDTFWNLFTGPFNFMWSYVRTETACSIQSQWEEKVLQEAQGAVDQQAIQYLLSQDGPVWKFAKGPLAPFLGWNPRKGYYSKVALGGDLPFDAAFFTFLTKGAKVKVAVQQKPNHGVTIRGLPTDANPDARIKPQSTRLELQCHSGSQVLENLNFPITRKFAWSPETCGDVFLQIDVGDQILTKRYEGPQAFPDFLEDFKGGRHTFTTRDFPGERASLDRMGIKYIRVNYQFSGNQTITGQARSLPGQAPRAIIRCWD
jgi:type VI secretion system protein ImpL